MRKVKLSKRDVRRLAVHGQFEFNTKDRDTGSQAARVIRHLGYVQIDTISVVERAHHHIIWSRLHSYQKELLSTLQESPRRVFEYWAHAASYLPIEDYRFCLPRIHKIQSDGFKWYPRVDKDVDLALKILEENGPMQARDFEAPSGRKSGAWWDWKPMKIALEHLFHEGRVMVVNRNKFQKIYDLTHRVLPKELDTSPPTDEEMAAYLIGKTLRSLGVASEKDFSYGRKHGIQGIPDKLVEMLESNNVTQLEIEDVKRNYYVNTSLLSVLETHNEPRIGVRLLSPFDNQVIIRQRLKEIFDFDYQLECYVPQAKRKYGYFSLPILYNDNVVGILDAKAHRKEKLLTVNHLYLTNVPEDMEDFLICLAREINAYNNFNKCTKVILDKLHPKGFKRRLNSLLKR